MPDVHGLTDDERAILAFEQLTFRYEGSKDQEIRDRFGISRTRYAQRLNALIDRPEALAADPVLVHRLQRLRDQRRRKRAITRRIN